MTQQRVSPISVTSVLPAVPVLSLQAALGQSANLTEWKNSSGTIVNRILSDGSILSSVNLDLAGQTRLGNWPSAPTAQASVTGNSGTSLVTFAVKAQVSQTADLQQWQNSAGTVLAAISAAGILNLTGSGTLSQIQSSTDASRILWVKGLSNSVRIGTTTGAATIEGVDATNGQTSYQPLNVGGSTINLQTGAANRISIDGSGNIAIGGALDTAVNFRVNRNVTGGTSAHQITASGTIQSDVTSTAYYLRTFAATQATSFTLTNLFHYHADGASIGAGSTITNNFGFTAPSSMTYGTNNFGFYGNIASASNRWNFYANGTAANYFAGQTTVGSTSLTLGSGSVAQQFGVVSGAATTVGAVIRGAASQTGDLTQWQNSAGTNVAKVEATGRIVISQPSTAVTSTISSLNYIVSGASNFMFVGENTSASSSSQGAIAYLVTNDGAALASGDRIGGLLVAGSSSASSIRNAAAIYSFAAENWVDASAYGTYLTFETISNGATTRTEKMRIDGDGNFGLNGTSFGSGKGVVAIANAGTIPSANPTGGGVLYVEGGALKYRGSSGTVTTIANA